MSWVTCVWYYYINIKNRTRDHEGENTKKRNKMVVVEIKVWKKTIDTSCTLDSITCTCKIRNEIRWISFILFVSCTNIISPVCVQYDIQCGKLK